MNSVLLNIIIIIIILKSLYRLAGASLHNGPSSSCGPLGILIALSWLRVQSHKHFKIHCGGFYFFAL